MELNETNFWWPDINEAPFAQRSSHAVGQPPSGNGATKTRAEVRGGGGKTLESERNRPRQSHGSSRSPYVAKGGIIFRAQAPDYGYKMPKKVLASGISFSFGSKSGGRKFGRSGKLNVTGNRRPKPEMEGLKQVSNWQNRKALVVIALKDEKVTQIAS